MEFEWWMLFLGMVILGPIIAIGWKQIATKPPVRPPTEVIPPREEIRGCLYVMPMVGGWVAFALGLIGLLWRLI
jgi:hypothetical protein